MMLLQFIVGMALLILLHEAGHFLVSKLFKIEVEEFGIGFPPKLLKLFEKNGTIYSLNWIPLGGFVKLKGENDPRIPGGFAASNPWARLSVLSAGPLVNLIAGVFLAILFFYTVGDPILDKVMVISVQENTPASQAGLQKGDIFVSVNGAPVDSREKLQELVDQNLGKEIELVLEREGSLVQTWLVPREEPPSGQGPMGVEIGNPTQPISLATAIVRGFRASWDYVRGIVLLPVRILQGEASPEEGRLIGYRGMYEIYQRLNSLYFFMVISLSLGLMNLLPFPALDGGRILLTWPEIFFKKRIPHEYENALHVLGFMLLLLLLIYVNIQDFLNPIQLP